MIPGLKDNAFEFFTENGEVFLIHEGKTYAWKKIPISTLDLIHKAWILPENSTIRNYIKGYINDHNERLKEFCRIVWGQLDYNPDITIDEKFNFESLEDYHLSKREKQFIKLVCQDLSDKEIADKMGIAYNTATTYRQNITNKIGVKTKIGIALFAFKDGIV